MRSRPRLRASSVRVKGGKLSQVSGCRRCYFGLQWISPGLMTSLVAQTVKRLSTRREPRVRSLGLEIPWRRKWQSTPVLLPGKSHGQRSLVGYSPWGRKESDTTERLHLLTYELEFSNQKFVFQSHCYHFTTILSSVGSIPKTRGASGLLLLFLTCKIEIQHLWR